MSEDCSLKESLGITLTEAAEDEMAKEEKARRGETAEGVNICVEGQKKMRRVRVTETKENGLHINFLCLRVILNYY